MSRPAPTIEVTPDGIWLTVPGHSGAPGRGQLLSPVEARQVATALVDGAAQFAASPSAGAASAHARETACVHEPGELVSAGPPVVRECRKCRRSYAVPPPEKGS